MARYTNAKNLPRRHFQVTPNDTTDIPDGPVELFCAANGVAQVHDFYGNLLAYTLTAGQKVPVLVRRLRSTSTTGTWYALGD